MTDFSHFQITSIENFPYRGYLKKCIFRHFVSFTLVIMRKKQDFHEHC